MTVRYDRLWKTLANHNWNRTKLREETGMSTSTLAKMGKNEYVSLEIVGRICESLQCQPEDIFEIIYDVDSKTEKENLL